MSIDTTFPLFETRHEHILIYHAETYSELNPCPECKNSKIGLYHYECSCGLGGWKVICWPCYMRSEELIRGYESAEMAVKAWNENLTANSIPSAKD